MTVKQKTDRLMTLAEVAERTLMPEASLRWKRHQGELPFLFKIGRRLVANESDVEAWIADQQRKARQEAEYRLSHDEASPRLMRRDGYWWMRLDDATLADAIDHVARIRAGESA